MIKIGDLDSRVKQLESQWDGCQGIRDHRCILGPFESRLKGASWSDKELHEKALEEARKKQKSLATKLKKERNSL